MCQKELEKLAAFFYMCIGCNGPGSPGLRLPECLSKALLAGIFVLGIGTGLVVDSAINMKPKDLASLDAMD
jgi:hypothetical protein